MGVQGSAGRRRAGRYNWQCRNLDLCQRLACSLYYFIGVIAGYYGNILLCGGNVHVKAVVYWLVFAVVGAVIGFIVWNSRAKEWLGGICAAVPVSLLAAEAWPIYKAFTIPLAFDVVCAVILLILLAPGKYQKLMALPFIIIFTFALVYFSVFGWIFGGWI